MSDQSKVAQEKALDWINNQIRICFEAVNSAGRSRKSRESLSDKLSILETIRDTLQAKQVRS